MPPYSGVHFQVLLRARRPDAKTELITVTAREWESSVTLQHPKITTHQLLGRIRNLDVELFSPFPKLRSELEALDYTVRELDSSKSMSIYADTKFSERSLVQKLQDQLYDALRVDGEEVAYGIIAATQNEWMLVCKLDRERYNPQNPCPPVITTHQAAYDTIGYILDNQVIILSPEKKVKKFLLNKDPWVLYKFLDATVSKEKERAMQEEKEERIRQFKKDKRKAQKEKAAAAAAAGKSEGVGTEQERLGVLAAAGKDIRSGGKVYVKET